MSYSGYLQNTDTLDNRIVRGINLHVCTNQFACIQENPLGYLLLRRTATAKSTTRKRGTNCPVQALPEDCSGSIDCLHMYGTLLQCECGGGSSQTSLAVNIHRCSTCDPTCFFVSTADRLQVWLRGCGCHHRRDRPIFHLFLNHEPQLLGSSRNVQDTSAVVLPYLAFSCLASDSNDIGFSRLSGLKTTRVIPS